ncbi:glycosyltransferase 8 domain-containing protein 1-like [Littorina saxatilis]|uniref:Glycosyltransferase 8 domain-containing protein 1 n=1 Tax=Littorina saxatilis TaxID=31220 RepID=A0AAN9G2V4_9CAEN
MVVSNVKKVLLVLLVVWIGTLSYIWLPGIVPDFLHLRNKAAADEKDARLKDALGKFLNLGIGNASLEHASKGTEEAVHVVIASDSNTLGGMIALINSIVSNTKSLVFFHLITDKASSEHLKTWLMKSKLQSINYEIKEFPVEWVEGKIKVRGGREELANPLNYARYYLPKLFPNIEGRVVYIDDDCIVQGDVKHLYDMKMHPGTLASFSEDCMGVNKRITLLQNVYADFFDLKNKHFMELNIKPTACSFNTGVFVTNLTDWRKHNITHQLEHWLELNTKEELYGNERGGGGSQPPMMLVFYKKYTPMDQLWHVHFLGWNVRRIYGKQYIKSAKLLHWNGRSKPWGRNAAFQDSWDRYFLPDPTKQFQPVRKGIL